MSNTTTRRPRPSIRQTLGFMHATVVIENNKLEDRVAFLERTLDETLALAENLTASIHRVRELARKFEQEPDDTNIYRLVAYRIYSALDGRQE